MTPLRPLSPVLHRAYVEAIAPALGAADPLPADVRSAVDDLLARRRAAPDADHDRIDAELVGRMYYYVLRPDVIARDVLRLHRWRSPITIEQATLVLAAIGEAGYPIGVNGAPAYEGGGEYQPVRGEERDRVVWAAARYWAAAASQHLTYVSLGDRRGYLPRTVQYDEPGRMHPQQQASLTLGPAVDRRPSTIAYMRRHTRRLILVVPPQHEDER